jgi:hypothetical protein
MLNFSHHHSLKQRFQNVLSVLISNQTKPIEMEFLVNLIDYVIRDDRSRDALENPYQLGQLELRAIILGLYHHQDLLHLLSYFNESEYEYLTIALAIALTMRGEMQPRSFVSKIFNYPMPSNFYGQLKLANTLADTGKSRAIARSQIPEASLAYSIYCFLSTPYSWDLVNQGAGQFQISISAIASAYLGSAYLGLDLGYLGQFAPHLKLGKSLGNYVLAAWSGVYDLSNIPSNFYPAIKYPENMSIGA